MTYLKKESGFTLIELIIVIAILAIIATIAIPNVLDSIERSRKATDVASGKIIADAAGRILAQEGQYSGFELVPFNINGLSTSFTEGGDLTDDFQAELFTQNNQAIPIPKYKVSGMTLTNYILLVEEGRTIEVYIGDGVDIATTGSALMIYPEPDIEYTQ
jgi:prepilin-type N-terminal cleavage/methylation domain-containing protein